MAVSPPAPLRGSSSRPERSRLGCKTCKIRRVKCGEEKPSCLRCTSTGRKCEYETKVVCYTSSSSILPDKPLSLYSNTVWRERRAFAYYFQHAAASVGGGLDVDFWHTIVPQVCRNEPAVWDAMISISALFESPDPCPVLISISGGGYSRTLNQNQKDALDWYSRSVSAVRRGIARGGVDSFVGLITCVLFICIEVLLGNLKEAMHLYGQGVHLIQSLQAPEACETMTATEISFLKDTIVPIFIRLGAVSPGIQVGNLLRDYEHSFTQEFSSLKAAREAIVALSAEIHFFEFTCEEYLMKTLACSIPQEMITQQKALSARLQNWHTAFTNLMVSLCKKDVLPPLQHSTGAVLLAYHEMLCVILTVCESPSRITTDACTRNFENIIEQAKISFNGSARYDGTQPPFTFELGIGFPLWFTCIRCREPSIRRTALEMLGRGHQAQGLNKREHGTIVCEAIMMLEETYGMVMNGPQNTIDFMPSKANNLEYQSYCQGSSSIPSSPFSIDSELASSPPSSLTEMEPETPPATTMLVPEGARVKPLGVFQPRYGYPPQTTEEDVAKWRRSRDQMFLQFSRNIYNRSSNTWETIYGCVPVDLY